MTTVRHLEKLWNSKAHARSIRELLVSRPEASLRLEQLLDRNPLAAAALILIRLDELGQAHVTLAGKLLRTILAAQEADGGWRNPLLSALCLRALLTCRGNGDSVDRGLAYLASLQRPEGIWPNEPIRRMPADAFISAFVLLQLGASDRFAAVVRMKDAAAWFSSHEDALDPEARRVWDHAMLRLRVKRPDRQVLSLWS
jgi:hypothetical protein